MNSSSSSCSLTEDEEEKTDKNEEVVIPKLEKIHHHSPSHITFLISGKLPEIEVVFKPALEVKDADWRIGLDEPFDPVQTKKKNRLKYTIKYPINFEVTVTPSVFESSGTSTDVLDYMTPTSKSSFEGWTCINTSTESHYECCEYHPIKLNGLIEKIKINAGRKPKKSRKNKTIPKRKMKLAIPENKMNFRFHLKTSDAIKLKKIESELENLTSQKHFLQKKVAEKMPGKKIPEPEKCVTCKQELKIKPNKV